MRQGTLGARAIISPDEMQWTRNPATEILDGTVVADVMCLVGIVTKTDLIRARQLSDQEEEVGYGNERSELLRALGEEEGDEEDAEMIALGFAERREDNLGFHMESDGPLTAGRVMTRDPVAVGPQTSLGHALTLMGLEGISSLPVVTPRGVGQVVVGMISTRDIVCWLAERTGYLRPATSAGADFYREWREGDAPKVAGCAVCDPPCVGC